MKAVDKIIEKLPLPVIVAVAIVVVTAWLFKELGPHDDYGPVFRDKRFLTIAVITSVLLPIYYGLVYVRTSRNLRRLSTPKTAAGIWIAKFDGDESGVTQRSLVEELRQRLSRFSGPRPFEVRYLDHAVSGATLKERHRLARELGKQCRASVVIWGDVIGKKQFLHLSLLSQIIGGSQGFDISPIIADLTEVELPPDLLGNIDSVVNYLLISESVSNYEAHPQDEQRAALLNEVLDSLDIPFLTYKEPPESPARELWAAVSFLRGYAYFFLDRFDDSERAFRYTLKLHEKIGLAANTYLGILAFNQGRPWEEVVDYLLNGVSNSLNWYAIGKVAFNAKQLDAAKHAFDKSLEYERDNPYTHYYLARLDSIEGHHERAIRSLNTSIALFEREHGDIACEPDEIGIADAYASLGMAYDEAGDLRRAVGTLKRALDLRPNDSFVHNYLGTVYAKLDSSDKAIASFQAAIAADSNNHRAYFNLGSVLVSQGQTDQAIAMYERAAELDDGYIQPHVQLAKLYEQLGRNDSAIEEYDRCMAALDLSEEMEPSAKQELADFIQGEIRRVRTQ